jgi:hypothetical protein
MAVDANRLRNEFVYESQAPLPNLLADLDQMTSIVSGWHASRRRLITTAVVVLLVGGPFIVIFVPLGLAAIAVSIYLFFKVKTYPKMVVNQSDRCDFARSVALMLSSDADPKTPVKTRLAFGTAQNMVGETKLHHRRDGVQRMYKTPLLSLEARMLDGTTVTETIDELIRIRSFKTPRGKSKSKTRTRFLLSMRFVYDADTYGDVSRSGAKLDQEIQLPQSSRLQGGVLSSKESK